MRIGVISDHLSTTTGFRYATAPFVEGFLEKGWDVHYLGIVGAELDFDDPRITMTRAEDVPLVKDGVIRDWLLDTMPDVVFAVRDPGTLVDWTVGPQSLTGVWTGIKDGHINAPLFKMVFYIPIEGIPLSRTFALAFEPAIYSGGKLVFYTPTAVKVVKKQFPLIRNYPDKLDFVYHGLDHFPENNYSAEDRHLLKEMAGFEGRFLVMSVGTNKRTKGMAEAIYTASAYKTMFGPDEVMFYLHTDPSSPMLGGHDLFHLRQMYDVESMVAFKPESNHSRRKNVLAGIDVSGDQKSLLSRLAYLKDRGFTPTNAEEAYANLRHYRFTDLFAMSDLYLDLSQLEGWGLPVGEAMRWGLPVMGVEDRAVRDEIYGAARILIEPEDQELWDTFNSGARLVKVRPSKVAQMIKYAVMDRIPLKQAIRAGKQRAAMYPWKPSVDKMVKIIEECYSGTG